MKFDDLVNEILKEGIGDPAAEADAVRAGNAARDQRLADLGARSSYSSGPRRRYDDEKSTGPHWTVFGDDRCKNWYKNHPDPKINQSTMAKYGWKCFKRKFDRDAEKKAYAFAAKWGLKEPSFSSY